jgi:hypothetical protein
MHWCLPGVPDTWVDILAAQILHYLKQGKVWLPYWSLLVE